MLKNFIKIEEERNIHGIDATGNRKKRDKIRKSFRLIKSIDQFELMNCFSNLLN